MEMGVASLAAKIVVCEVVKRGQHQHNLFFRAAAFEKEAKYNGHRRTKIPPT